LVVGGERKEFAEPPDAGEVERVVPAHPLGLEVLERLGNRKPVPVVGHVQKPTALRALEAGVRQVGGRPAPGVDAPLEGNLRHAPRTRRGGGSRRVFYQKRPFASTPAAAATSRRGAPRGPSPAGRTPPRRHR